jgi:DNA-binding response OmpR family regulator
MLDATHKQTRGMSAKSAGALPAPSVLIVEDEILIGLGLAMALNVAGYRVHGPTGSVRRALSIAAEASPEIGLIDINLRGHAEGVALARLLHQRYATTIVFLTAQLEEARLARDCAFGMVAKPYDLILLPRIVETAARHRRGEPLGPLPCALEVFR